MDKFSYTWVKTFSLRKNNTLDTNYEPLPYPENFPSNLQLSWALGVILNPIERLYKDYVSVFLIFESSRKVKEIWASFKFSIINNEGKKVKSVESRKPCKFVRGQHCRGFRKFIRRDILLDKSKGLLVKNKFTIVCEVNASSLEFYDNTKSICEEKYKVPECSLLDDFWSMYENKKFSDVTIIVKDREFKAHKNILGARSPVFSAMFEQEMEESKQNQVNIIDIDPPVFDEMLHYVYTGKSPNLDTMAEELLAVADKYQMERLKIMCGKALFKNLSINNAAKILYLADLHSIGELKTRALDFISTYVKDVMETEGFKLITASYPQLLAEIFHDYVIKTASLDEKQEAVLSYGYFSESGSEEDY